MSRDNEDRLLALAAAISDGVPVDWDALESSASSADELKLLRELRVVFTLTAVHRTAVESDDDGRDTAATAAVPAPRAVPHWSHFALLDRLGGGSQGEVFRAIDTRLDRHVALKLLKPSQHSASAANLLTEARLLARVRHPNVVTVHGAEHLDGRVGLWMELVNGETLESLVHRGGTLSAVEAALLGIDLCGAVGAVHAAGLLHRDIKAQNVMRESGGRFVLMDFGTGHDAANTSIAQRAGGTPLYLAPEIFEGHPATVASDIYSLGVLLFYLVTGRFPVRGHTVADLADAHRNQKRERLSAVRADLPAAFVSCVERAIHPTPSARFQSASEMSDALRECVAVSPARQPSLLWVATAALAAVLGAAALWMTMRPQPDPVASVAVFAFDDLSADGSLGHIGRGLADLLTTDLGQHTTLRVVATYSGDSRAVRQRGEVARTIDVDTIVEGSLRPADDGLAVSVRVVQAGSGTVLWSETFNAQLRTLLDTERMIASRVAEALRSRFTGASRAGPTPPADALEAYFRGWQEYYGLSPNPTRLARDQFARAVALAPDFAQAQAALGYVTGLLGTSYREIPIADAIAEAERLGELARSLDPTYGFAEALLGWVRATGHWDWSGAEVHYRRAIELNPSDANTRALYSQLLMANNRLEPALSEARIAQRLEPLNSARISTVAICLYYLRRYEEAIAEDNLLLAANPSSAIAHLGLGRFLAQMGQYDEAVAMIRSGPNRDVPPVQAELARILYLAGQHDAADRITLTLRQAFAEGRLSPDQLAFVEVARGRHDDALALLRDAVDARLPSVIWIGVDPRFDPLRPRPDFQDLVRRLQLLD
jgi:TolB-like protein/Flp pilus assembly protein TadD